MKEFTFYQLSDLHIYATNEIGSYGKFFEKRCSTDQKCIAESEAIVDAAFSKVCEDKDTELIIISGDLTNDGEIESHKMLLGKLQKLKDAGKKVYVTFATHDYNMEARRFTDEGEFLLPKFTREELREFYKDFGWNDAVSEHVPSYSYAVVPYEGVRFLMLNDDGDGREFCGYDETQMAWIKAQADEAKEKGERVIAVTHHPVLPPSIVFPLFSHRDMLGAYEETAPALADMGIEYVFTGHTHMQAIDYIDTDKGNRLYHINTGSVVGYNAPYRKVTVNDLGIDVKTHNIEDFEWDKNGMSAQEYLEDHFSYMIRRIFDTMENDIEEFKEYAIGFSMEASTVDKLKPIILFLGKLVNSITFKSVGRVLLLGKKIDKSIENRNVRDFALDLITSVFTGIKKYPPKSPEYKAMMAAAKRLSGVVKFKDFYGNVIPLEKIAEDLLWDSTDYDNTNAFLPY